MFKFRFFMFDWNVIIFKFWMIIKQLIFVVNIYRIVIIFDYDGVNYLILER